MSNHEEQTSKIIAGTVIGGIIGLGALSIYCLTKKCKKKTSLDIIKDTVSHVFEVIETCKEGAQQAVKEVDSKLKESEGTINQFLELASVGISLWKKISKEK
jgi:gas vesicle protein